MPLPDEYDSWRCSDCMSQEEDCKSEWQDCEECKGTGILYGEECDNCSGSGGMHLCLNDKEMFGDKENDKTN